MDTANQFCAGQPMSSNIKASPLNSRITVNAHLARDLNSPSACIKVRAMNYVKDPQRYPCYLYSDNNEEADLITAEERAHQANHFKDLMKTVFAYVEIRSGCENSTNGIKKFIASTLGVNVNDTLKRNTTHVIFQNGRLSTYKKAKKLGIPIVSILWVDACITTKTLCSPAKYPIQNLLNYEEPEIYGGPKRCRFMCTERAVQKKTNKKTNKSKPKLCKPKQPKRCKRAVRKKTVKTETKSKK